MQCQACGKRPPSISEQRRKARNRYDLSYHVETQYQPGSNRRVLKNLRNIRSAREMARVEQRELIRTIDWVTQQYDANHRFTAQDLCTLHQKWLGPLYAWAGEYRQVNVSKAGFLFATATLIPQLMQELETSCLARYTPLRVAGTDAARALAETHVELLLIHPFREGNGRLARVLATSMAWQAGFRTPAFEEMLRHYKQDYFAAVRAGLDRDYEPMRRIFTSLLDAAPAQAAACHRQ